MVGGLDFHGYGRSCSTWNAFEIPKWKELNSKEKEEEIIKILRNREQDKLKVLMYKDRPYYTEANLAFSPIKIVFNYFRTLNIYQILSWIVWLVIFNIIHARIKRKMDKVTQHIESTKYDYEYILLLKSQENQKHCFRHSSLPSKETLIINNRRVKCS